MNKPYPFNKTEDAWRKLLSQEEYRVLREQGTEYPHSGAYNSHYEKGTYNCRGCNQPLYASDSKFDSGCGWPSYDQSIEGAIEYRKDSSHGMVRVEIVCSNCGGHQGHVFDDGPTASGKRYCVNSASISFEAKKED
ncbi:peptide-methionine (R)-S-oxide reductase MsrB [Flavobacteriaceae bacterium]|jgi:peptide-methionine (R)-S-oxide reductase|nr:peptide-methionine (R)-S-oxide reductase MsrB [Flavobacteriaceae bacterium]MDA9351489.1 peptide-methionine (R)-S-oxide reductase MsrB [Flavobacteriaceae bacterium]MDB4067590.1 peptide-methionine (R)-S-oxide reductase MsrB [Flavobacteriaceae bacterium]MDB4152160.1 peptide-methionine (R)-S-oxide reductase MsrB [Flavobacteriaceae bacterium]MDB9988946.1 peptide-methionine (R)-S-oxide reductase MsrB [Flavobacteriaceae bacterium]|tara:strand:+ start:8930 stop:9337 length:408 start_codon:yes stop_codon:yes gene_type:complete